MPSLLGSEEHTSELQSPCNLVCRLFLDRKSTRLNSSHLVISYAVFCLKKKTKTEDYDFRVAVPQPEAAPPLMADIFGNDHVFFFFNDTATTEIYTLSLHDALPI